MPWIKKSTLEAMERKYWQSDSIARDCLFQLNELKQSNSSLKRRMIVLRQQVQKLRQEVRNKNRVQSK